jgi:hypothetical protein
MGTVVRPSRKGQIVKCVIPPYGYGPEECFILAEDPAGAEGDHGVRVYSVTRFLRAHAQGDIPDSDLLRLSDLLLVADDMQRWVESWNQG